MSTSPVTVSVVVPCHNAEPYLGRTLASICAQSWRDLEIIVVDDGSTDGSVAVAEGLGDPRLRVVRQAASGGPSAPRNRGIAEARGRLVFFCDADDVMRPGKVEAQVALLKAHPDVGLVFTDFEVIDLEDRVLEGSFLAPFATLRRVVAAGPGPEGGLRRDRLLDGLLRANFIGTSSVAVRKSVLDDVGGFDPALPSSEDLDLWLRIARCHACAFLDLVGHGYRRRPGSVMHDNSPRHPLARIEVLERQLAAGATPAQRRVIRQWIARNLCGLGYLSELQGDHARARTFHLESLRARPNLQAAWGWGKATVREAVGARGGRQFLAYAAIGAVGTGFHYLTLVALVSRARLDPVAATSCGFVVGAVVNYVGNYHLTFRSRRGHVGTMGRFFAVAAAGMAVNAAVMALCHRALGIHYLVSQVLATGLVVVLTFLANRAWTFREVSDDRAR